MQNKIDKPNFQITLEGFGFQRRGQSDKDIYGICPFCSKPKFYFNIDSSRWKCHSGSCQREGGFYSFITNILLHHRNNIEDNNVSKLIEHRGIKVKTLKLIGAGFIPEIGKLLIPIYFFDNKEKVQNIIQVKGKGRIFTKGCKTGLMGWERINKKIKKIWLCEGVFDYLTLFQVLKFSGKKNDIAVGCPGSNIFKQEWAFLFENKEVNILYDNDEAGKAGMFKAYNILQQYASSVKFLQWPAKAKEKEDINDLYLSHDKKAIPFLQTLNLLLSSKFNPIKTKTGKVLKIKEKTKSTTSNKSIIPYQKVYDTYTKWLHLPKTDPIDLLYGTILANRLDDVPVWLFFVAPSGGTKTALILSISESESIEAVSSLTPHTLVSGMTLEGGIDPSLIPKLDQRVLVIKDFTAILSMIKAHRDQIIGDLRDAFDGSYNKSFGNAKQKRFKSKFGVIAGVTPEIESYIDDSTAMGERFLRYNLPIEHSIDGRKGFIKRALKNRGTETAMREELSVMGTRVLESDYNFMPSISEEYEDRLVCLAHWVCMVRGVVNRDKYSKQVTRSPYIEVGTRVAKQLCNLSIGITQFKGKKEFGEAEYNTVKTCAISSVPRDNALIFNYLYHNSKRDIQTKEIAEKFKLPDVMVDRVLQDLRYTKVIDGIRKSAFTFLWRIKDDVLKLTEDSKIYNN